MNPFTPVVEELVIRIRELLRKIRAHHEERFSGMADRIIGYDPFFDGKLLVGRQILVNVDLTTLLVCRGRSFANGFEGAEAHHASDFTQFFGLIAFT